MSDKSSIEVDIRRRVKLRDVSGVEGGLHLLDSDNGLAYAEPGEIQAVFRVDGTHKGFISACPGCGEVGDIDQRWTVQSGDPRDIEHLTLTPSVHCRGCCGWHGYFRDGEAVPC